MYTIHIFHSLTFKNKLHKELYQFFEEVEHAVFEDLDQMKELITNKVEHLNTEHKRCKPIKISFDEIQPNNIDTTNVECRRNPNKKKF